jgi:porphobilinogen synthase
MKRLQRMRATVALRDLVSEIGFGQSQLIQPLFLAEGVTKEEPLSGLPGNSRHTLASLLTQFEKDLSAGVRQFILFPVPASKSNRSFQAEFVGTALGQMRQRAGNDAAIWVDTCICSFTETGHCCVHDSRGQQDLAATHSALGVLGLTYVKAGADGIAPSDMNDGRVAFLRATLDKAGYDIAPIMSYSTKFASNFYGPFRDAADSAPQFGDRRSYQLDVRNRSDALASSRRCAEEGADLLMVKPGQPSADLIRPIAEQTGLPVGAYQVSGEYTSLVLLSREKFLDFEAGLLESWYNLRRAGASFIITYGARLARGLPGIGS